MILLPRLLEVDWTNPCSPNPLTRAVSWAALAGSAVVVLSVGAVLLVKCEWERWRK